MEKEENQVQNGVATEASSQPNGNGEVKPNPTQEVDKPKSFSQDQVNDIVRERLERDRKSFFTLLNVKDEEELKGFIEKGRGYAELESKLNQAVSENATLNQTLAFMRNNVKAEKQDEIKALFKGYGLEFNEENLKAQLSTHPEWLNVAPVVDTTPKGQVKSLGVEHENKNVPESDAARAKRLFGD